MLCLKGAINCGSTALSSRVSAENAAREDFFFSHFPDMFLYASDTKMYELIFITRKKQYSKWKEITEY